MTKRRRFIIQSTALSLGLLFIQSVDISWRYWAILGIGSIAYFFTAWSLREEIRKISWLIILPLPALYTGSIGLFYFLLPAAFLTRIIVVSLFGVGMYALLLTENIFSVAAIRTIQLLRAAQAVGFLITLLTIFFIYDTIFSFKLIAWQNIPLIFGFSFIVVLQAIWSISLEDTINKRLILITFVLSLMASELAFFISFWPLSITALSLFLVSFWYVILGIVQNWLVGKLFSKTLNEYIRVALIIFIITFFLSHWGG